MPIFKKRLIILSILLAAILAVSAVSAAENITDTKADDALEPLGEIDEPQQDTLESGEGSDDFQIDIRNTNIKVGYPHMNLEDIGTLSCPGGVSGNVSVTVGSDVIRTFELSGNASTIILDYNTLKLPFGRNTMKIDFANQTGSRQLYNGWINVDYYMEICCGREYGDEAGTDYPLFYDNSWTYHVDVPKDADGKLYVSIDANAYEPATYKRGISVRTISPKGLSIGAHTIKAKLVNDSIYPEKTVDYTFYVTPKITVPAGMAVGEMEYVLIDLPDDYRGTARIFKSATVYEDGIGEYYIKGQLIATADVNGDVKIQIPEANIGENAIYVNITGSGDYEDYFYMDYYPNDPKFSSSISSNVVEYGSKVILTINAPKSDTNLYVYVDGVEYDSVDLDGERTRMAISRLSVGQHHIKLEYYVESYDANSQRVVEKFYSNSFYVTVKKSTNLKKASKTAAKTLLTLKAVKVKKSAKKLILQATLKQGGKVLKGKTITFKFNGKKYTAKTGRKGIAKVTVKKSILKKLKVGEKVKYQASFAKITVKKTAIIRK